MNDFVWICSYSIILVLGSEMHVNYANITSAKIHPHLLSSIPYKVTSTKPKFIGKVVNRCPPHHNIKLYINLYEAWFQRGHLSAQ